jgi:hypothetical protein
VILKIILPLILQGVPPLPMAVVGATAITTATILLTEGWGKSSAAAILGTAGSLSVAGLIAAAVTAAAQFTYTSSDLAYIVTQGGAGLDLRGILLAAVILGSLGVLDDVTVTQAVVVDELSERGSLEGRELFRSALGIGRSHIGATVNTLFLAYVGASLPLLVVLLINNQPTALIWNNEEIATEIVRTLAGSLGIVAAVPLTTFVAVLLVGSANRTQGDPAAARRTQVLTVIPVLAICAVVVVLLGATAILPRTGPNQVLATGAPLTDPNASGEAVPSDGAGVVVSGDPGGPDAGEPLQAEREEAVDITVDGAEVGTASVDQWTLSPGAGGQAIAVSVTYAAKADWPIDPAAWEILTADGVELPLVADPAMPASLATDQTATYSLLAETAEDLTGAFIAYVDTAAQQFVFVVSLE